MDNRQPPLGLNDAVTLANALGHALAKECGVRVLTIKGLAADIHGLRPPRVAADADLWVEPGGSERLVSRLGECGWVERATSLIGSSIVTHSASLVHDKWPCDVDVHHQFPGFFADERHVFDRLWERRIAHEVAGFELQIPDRASSILIGALHALRTPGQSPRHALEYEALVNVVLPSLSEGERNDLVLLAIELGVADSARPLLEHLSLDLPAPTPFGVDPQLDAWRLRVGTDAVASVQALVALMNQPARARPRMLWRFIWPSEADLRIDDPNLSTGRSALVRRRVRRLARAVRSVPVAVVAYRATKRGMVMRSTSGSGDL